jgi:hypothetical protein
MFSFQRHLIPDEVVSTVFQIRLERYAAPSAENNVTCEEMGLRRRQWRRRRCSRDGVRNVEDARGRSIPQRVNNAPSRVTRRADDLDAYQWVHVVRPSMTAIDDERHAGKRHEAPVLYEEVAVRNVIHRTPDHDYIPGWRFVHVRWRALVMGGIFAINSGAAVGITMVAATTATPSSHGHDASALLAHPSPRHSPRY